MNESLTTLEEQALYAALIGTEPWKECLRRQVSLLRVVSRKYTGFGFYTDFSCKTCEPVEQLPPVESPERVPVAWAAHPDVENGGQGAITFNVFLTDGVISCLEGASTTSWPSTEEFITFA